jgi:putative sigma-54 modulation protein
VSFSPLSQTKLLYSQVKNGHRVEVVTDIKGTTIICKNESPDMYESIDQAAHALQRKLVKYKGRRVAGHHGGMTMGDDMRSALEEIEAEADEQEQALMIAGQKKNANVAAAATAVQAAVDPDDEAFFYEETHQKKTITPVKSFQLDRPISLEEAVFALDYIDHDFYVFRNQATNEINVVYKRHTGGIGHVAPEDAASAAPASSSS